MNLRRAALGPRRSDRATAPPRLDPEAAKLAAAILDESHQQLRRADDKSALLLASAGVAYGVILAAFLAGEWTPTHLHQPWGVLWWSGAACALLGVTALGVAVMPRIDHPESSDRVRYFADAARSQSLASLARSLNATAEEGHDRTLDQLWVVSQLALTKYELIRWALGFFAGATLATLTAVIGNSK